MERTTVTDSHVFLYANPITSNDLREPESCFIFMKTKLLLSVVIISLLSALSAYAANEYDFKEGGVFYKILSVPEMTVSVVKGDVEYTGKVTIPETVNYSNKTFKVTEIGESAFASCKDVTEVSLPEGLLVINNNAFSNCGLRVCNFPSTLKRLEDYSYSASSVREVILPNNLEYLGSGVFSNSKTERVIFGSNLKTTGRNLFSSSEVREVILNEGLEEIRRSNFQYCKYLTSIDIPESVRLIEDYAFSKSALETVTGMEGVRKITSFAFMECGQLKEIAPLISIEEFETGVFIDCSKLKSLTLGDNIKKFNLAHILNCNSLESLSIGKGIQTVILVKGGLAYPDKYSLESVPLKNWTIMADEEVPQCTATLPNLFFLDCTLYVPSNMVSLYQNAEPWKNFFNIKDVAQSSVKDVVTEGFTVKSNNGAIEIVGYNGQDIVKVYSFDGKQVYSGLSSQISGLNKGMYIVTVGEKFSKIIL